MEKLFKKIFSKKNIIVFLTTFILFFAITITFNKTLPAYMVSDVRPSAALNPVLGLAYGWPAAISCAFANFFSDLVSGYGIIVALMGFIPQLIYGLLPYYIWKLLVKTISMRTRLDSPYKVIAYVLLMAFNAIPIGIAVGLIQLYASGSGLWETALFAGLNDFVMCLAFGLPLMVLLDHMYSRFLHKGKRKLSGNEMIILISSLVQLLIFGLDILVVYLLHQNEETPKIWQIIYRVTIITTNSILLLSIIAMMTRHNIIKKNAGLKIISRSHGTIYVDSKKYIEFVSYPGDYPEHIRKADFLGYQGRNELTKINYERGWYVLLSCQKGCNMACAFCDCPGLGLHGNVTSEEFAYQLNVILDTHYLSHTKYFEINFMRMGEPTMNDELLNFIEYDLRKIITNKIDVEQIVPNVSTMLPRNKVKVERFILEYCRIKNEVYNGQALLQFSIHTTDNKIRSLLMADRSLPLEDIAEIAKKMPLPKGMKYALSFAVGDTLTIDIAKINKLFDKQKFMIKLTPIYTTYNAVDNGFSTMKTSLIKKLEQDFIKNGWDVIVFEDTHEEDNDDLTCGKLVLPSLIHENKKADARRIRYGIIAALKYEEDLFRAELSNVKKITLLNKPAYTGILGNNEVIIMQCGMGKVSAGICAQAMIDGYHPDYIINTGCAGALDPNLKVGDVVISDSVIEWDLDLRKIGLPLGYIDALGAVEMRANKLLADKIMSAKADGINVKRGIIVSGDQFVSTMKQRNDILKNFPGALCAEMEGAAIGQVCLQNGTPFCIIRSISDTADGNSGIDFKTFSEKASKISTSWLIKMLKKT
ncbi:MAG: 5'-methylthioadenosine/adenosylhomocysteine nucleosidase [Bacilli bacterium]|nr:5'-methylthioadenosine/adenosylhomocysteine nucleosidase [Bacilli bacterium]